MKLQINTDEKTIRIEESVNFYELCQMVKKLFPNDMWKEFKLETNVIQNWNSPIIIRDYPVYPINPYPMNPNPFQPPYQPTWITCDAGTNTENGFSSIEPSYKLNPGTFNIDCQAQN